LLFLQFGFGLFGSIFQFFHVLMVFFLLILDLLSYCCVVVVQIFDFFVQFVDVLVYEMVLFFVLD
jgi:hypothetical protein